MNTFTVSDVQVTWLTILALWTLAWKGIALWRAGRRNDKVWFVVLLFLNTAGILEILYLFVFSKREDNTKQD